MKNSQGKTANSVSLAWLVAIVAVGFATRAAAVDGILLIDQNRALAGNVTPGDSPGFPVTISLPGSYRLSGNLTGLADVDVIVITSHNVTVDLNGFAIIGPVTCTFVPFGSTQRIDCQPQATQIDGLGAGIRSAGNNTIVHNGTVRGMTGDGITLSGFASSARNISASHNTLWGINVARGSVTGSTVSLNAGGIRAELISDCHADRHDIGFQAGRLLTRSSSTISTRSALSCASGAGYSDNVLGTVIDAFTTPNCSNLGRNLCGNVPCP